MDNSTNLKLPFIAEGQAQKHVNYNEAIRVLDAIVHIFVNDRDLISPPSLPNEGDRYIVGPSAIEDWAGKDNQLVAFQDGAWMFYQPLEGWLAWIADEDKLICWDGINWIDIVSDSVNPTPLLGVNVTADATNRLSINSPASLFNHEGNGHQIKINKNTEADTASILFQSNWSGRAEFGLTGDDDWHIKVSPNGNNWLESVVIDKNNGYIGIRSPVASDTMFTLGSASYVGSFQVNTHANGSYARLSHLGGISNVGVRFFNASGGVDEKLCDMVFGSNGDFSYQDRADDGAFVENRFQLFKSTGIFDIKNGGVKVRLNSAGSSFIKGGDFGIGVDPSTKLHVNGPVRVGSYTVATVPNASSNGAGSIVYVIDETGGAVLAFSDGTNWRRITDRAVVS